MWNVTKRVLIGMLQNVFKDCYEYLSFCFHFHEKYCLVTMWEIPQNQFSWTYGQHCPSVVSEVLPAYILCVICCSVADVLICTNEQKLDYGSPVDHSDDHIIRHHYGPSRGKVTIARQEVQRWCSQNRSIQYT